MKTTIEELVKQINAKPLHRAATLTRAADAKEGEHKYELSFSSEAPYERFFGVEILGHKKTEVDLGWLKGGSAPLLLDHDRSKQIGVIEKARIEDGRGSAVVRFGRGVLSQEIANDVADGIRSNVSVGYYVEEMTLTKKGSNGTPDEYRVTKWKPFEVSIVSVPADESVGVGRSDEENKTNTIKVKIMSEETNQGAAVVKPEDVLKNERARVAEIRELGKAHNMSALAEKAIDAGTDLEAFRKDLLFTIAKRAPQTNHAEDLSKGQKKDLSRYSLLRALNAVSQGRILDGVEREMHEQACSDFKSIGKAVGGIGVPMAFLRATLTVDADGTNVAPGLVMPSFIDALRNAMVLREMGAMFLPGLTSDVTFPKGGKATAYWAGSGDTAADAGASTGKVGLAAKRLCCSQNIDKKLLMQSSPDVEAWLRNELTMAIADAFDLAGIAGTGADDQPTGVLYTSGIGSVAGGTNGADPTFANIVGMETAAANANGTVSRLGYVTNTKVRGKLKLTPKVASTDSVMIWGDGPTPLNGHRVGVTNAVPSNLTKGTAVAICSAILYGDWSGLMMAMFGGLDLTVDNLTRAKQAEIVLTANAYGDVAVRHAAAFAAMKDALTA